MLHMVIVETIVQCPNVLLSCVFVENTALTNTDKIYMIIYAQGFNKQV